MLNMLRAGVKNVIAMNGTKLPESIRKLSQEKEITLFVDGDRGGKLIIQNVLDNARIKYIAIAPDGKEVEELQGKEILMTLRRKMTVSEYLSSSREGSSRSSQGRETSSWKEESAEKISEKPEES